MRALANSTVLDGFRRWGYLEADLDPLGRVPRAEVPELAVSGPEAERAREIYCGPLAVEFMHVPDPAVRRWVQERMEAEPTPVADRWGIFALLARAQLFEEMLQARYLGNKRFSIEGVEALLPLLVEVAERAAADGAEQLMLAMSHRGRLNVIAHLVGRPATDLFAGFEDFDPRSVLGGGDVKYHLGATGTYRAAEGRELRVHLASNPSHLEAVDPVALGRARAKQQRLGPDSEGLVVPVTVHGDSAFAGQGILAESLNLSQLEGYRVGGTVQVVANNWIGFTTEPSAYASSRFATDVAKRLDIPIFHVNGSEPEAAVRAARIAVDFRAAFGRDVVVDLIGYRRHGHSEVDDPTITNPKLYRKIEATEPLWKRYAVAAELPEEEVETFVDAVHQELAEAQEAAEELERKPSLATLPDYWSAFRGGRYSSQLEVDTGVPVERLRGLAERLTTLPEDLAVHPKVERLLEQRREMGRGERDLDFGMAEHLAFATLLTEGIPVRLSGQDSRRGTFNHRHSYLVDTDTEVGYCPLQHLADDQAACEIFDSPLSEAAPLGFEYGFSRDYPEALVLWEAQFGDFANGAQVIIDQFVAAGEDKWGLLSGLVLLLPHGYEGQGPEHSSARVERYLQLAAEDNIQVCQPSTAGQYFHLLRRQARRRWRKPLVVFTPKSMLRHPAATSPLAALARPRFQAVIPDPGLPAEEVCRVLFCSGKIVHELRKERESREETSTAIIVLEQLYPFPRSALGAELERYAAARDLLWVQEEPGNQGPFRYVTRWMEPLVGNRHLRTVKRSESASPATGSAKAHKLEQEALMRLAFES